MRMELSGLHSPPDLHIPKHAQRLQRPDECPIQDIHAYVRRTEGLAVSEGGAGAGRNGGQEE